MPVKTPELLQTSANNVNFFPTNALVIEDEASVRSAVIRFLKIKRIDAVVVATGHDALTAINQQKFRPDLVLSDYNLRGSTDGVESIKALRTALGWNVPAIIMTGDIRSETIEAIAAHDISVLVKPFLANELLQQIERLHRTRKSYPE
jgi:DNA-binding response OmpR family regulator